jgi:replicative DNA helicase
MAEQKTISLNDNTYITKIEQDLLSILLCNKTVFSEYFDEIKADDFYEPIHKQIFSAMSKIKEDGKTVDLTILSEYFSQHVDAQFNE